MPFPDTPRVLYRINPLDEVVCQLRFPPLLRIEAEAPAAFQERVRTDFPLFQQRSSFNLPSKLGQLVQHEMTLLGSKAYVFESADRCWKLTLGREGLSLSCRRYERWEHFRERLEGPFQALLELYSPSYFGHVCLRYRDVIKRSVLGLTNVAWPDLFQPWIVGPLANTDVSDEVESVQNRSVIRLPDGVGRVDATYGLATDERDKDQVFLIDSHLYNDRQTGPTDVFQRLDALNRYAGRFFRWCISDALHGALVGTPAVAPRFG